MRKQVCLSLVIGILSGLLISILYINPYDGRVSMSYIVCQLSGSVGYFPLGFSMTELTEFALKLFPDFLFEMFVGISFYKSFCIASVYIFSRYTHREKWFQTEVGYLLMDVLLYQIIFVTTASITAALQYSFFVEKSDLRLMFWYLLLRGSWLFVMTMGINVMACFKGSHLSYSFILGVQYLFLTLLTFINPYPDENGDYSMSAKLIWWNPIAHQVIGWHRDVPVRNVVVYTFMEKMPLFFSFILYAVLGLCIYAIGKKVINGKDILLSDTGGE